MSADHIISGDWGTSTLRLRLVRPSPFGVVEEVGLAEGIAATHEAWLRSGRADRDGDGHRQEFYLGRLAEALSMFEKPIAGLPVYLSGMASSSVGLEEVAYAPVPFHLHDSLCSISLPASAACPHEVSVYGGLRWGERDVMRGEETQVMGLAFNEALALPDGYCVILPGTHSKHVRVEDATIVSFSTYLTGDLFEAIAHHTILKHSVTGERVVSDVEAFRSGVERASMSGLLPELFGLRCRDLLGGRTVTEGNAFLSGLLVGSELVSAGLGSTSECLVVAEDSLGNLYAEALEVLGFGGDLRRVPRRSMEEAVARAHALIHRGA